MKSNFTLENINQEFIKNRLLPNILFFIIGFISALLFTQFGASEEDTKLIEARLVQKCQAQFKAESPATGQDENSLTCYQEVLKTYPNNAEALAGLEKIEARYVIWIEGFLERELLDEASEYLRKLFLLNPLSPKLAELETRFKQLNLIAPLLLKCQAHFDDNRLTRGEGGNALACYRDVLTKDPNNADALAGIKKIEARYATMIEDSLAKGLQKKVKLYLERLQEVGLQSPNLAELEKRISEKRLASLLLECQAHFDGNRLTRGEGGNALACYRDVLTKYPNNADALAGIKKIEARYATMIEDSLAKGLQKKVKLYLERLQEVGLQSPNLAELEKRISEKRLASLLLKCQTFLDEDSLTRGPRGNALSCYKDVLTKYPNNADALAGLEKIEARYATLIKQELDKGDLDNAEKYLARLRKLNPNYLELTSLERSFIKQVFGPDISLEVGRLLLECQKHLNEDRLTRGQQGNALSCYRDVLTKDPNNAYALAGIKQIEERYFTLITGVLYLDSEQLADAENYLASLRELNPNFPNLAGLEMLTKDLAMLRSLNPNSPKLVELEKHFLELIEQMLDNLDNEELDEVNAYLIESYLILLHKINPNSPKLVDLVERFLVSVKKMIKLMPEEKRQMTVPALEYLGLLECFNLKSPKLEELKLWFQEELERESDDGISAMAELKLA